MKQIIIIPYYSAAEIKRYLSIAAFLKQFTTTSQEHQYLLCASAFIRPSLALEQAFLALAPTLSYHCQIRVRGFPQGPCAMFWEVMEHINRQYEKDNGFVLWLESDMLPVKSDWLDHLTQEWLLKPQMLLMGQYIPQTYQGKRLYCREHINGGACYAKDLAKFVPPGARTPAFDVSLFPHIKSTGRFRATGAIAFTHKYNFCDYTRDPQKTILHGFKQAKTKFITRGIEIMRNPQAEKKYARLSKSLPQWLRRCCPEAYWQKFAFNCPVHKKEAELKPLELKLKKSQLTSSVAFYIFYHDQRSLSSIDRQNLPGNFRLVNLRDLPIPPELIIPELSLEQNRDLFSESLALYQLEPSADMVGIFPYSIPLKFSRAWAEKTGRYDIFLPPVKFSDFAGKSFDPNMLYAVEFADFWRKQDPLERSIKKYINLIHRHRDFHIGPDQIQKGPFKNALIVERGIFLAFQEWFGRVSKYIIDNHGWNIVDTASDSAAYAQKSFHAHLGVSTTQTTADLTLRHKLSGFLERLCAYYFGQQFCDQDKVDLRFFKGE